MPGKQNGFIQGYILFAMAMLALIAMTMTYIVTGNRDKERISLTHRELVEQVELIRSQVILCRTLYPSGDNGTGVRAPYPATPVSGYVSDAECPGSNAANKNLWSGVDGEILPTMPFGFSAWTYANDVTSIRITTTGNGDPQTDAAASRTVNSLGADNASFNAGTHTLTVTLVR